MNAIRTDRQLRKGQRHNWDYPAISRFFPFVHEKEEEGCWERLGGWGEHDRTLN